VLFRSESGNVEIQGSDLNTEIVVREGRKLSTFTYDINFEVSFVSEIAYNFDGTNYYGLLGLTSELSDELSASMSSGQFAGTVRTLAMSSGANALDDVEGATLVSLKVEDITYLGTLNIMLVNDEENLATIGSMSTTVTSMFFNVISSGEVTFLAIVGVGFIALVGSLTYSLSKRRLEEGVTTSDIVSTVSKAIEIVDLKLPERIVL